MDHRLITSVVAVIFFFFSVVAGGIQREEDHYKKAFAQFVQDYDRKYSSPAEFSSRYAVFKENLQFIEESNAEYAAGRKSYTVGVNQFADMTSDEFASQYLTAKANTKSKVDQTPLRPAPSSAVIPSHVDWSAKNAVTYIKDQGQCGSCWSFSTTGAVEGAWAIAKGQLNSLSEQNIIDCTWVLPYNNSGCNGGDPRMAMLYVINNKGLDTEDNYPYDDYYGGDQQNCSYNASNSAAYITGTYDVISGNETDLMLAAILGTVSIAIDASPNSFQFYDGGVYSDPSCQNGIADLDHAVLVVGYDNGGGYWIVKNSWGPGWGMSGYIWMAKDDGNSCGIATYATLPLLS